MTTVLPFEANEAHWSRQVGRVQIVSEELLATQKPSSPPAGVKRPGTARHWRLPVSGLILVSFLGLAWWFFPRGATESGQSEKGRAYGASSTSTAAMRVEVVTPKPRGLGRRVVQPGIVNAFDKADLYAKVSGYLVRQKVDIGDAVKKGDLLAEVDVPELFKSRDRAQAALLQAKAKLKLSEARVLTFDADRQTAAATVMQAEADIAKFTAAREYRQKERDRIAQLVQRNAVERRLLDEQEQMYQEAVAAERTGTAAVATARAALASAEARIAQARAEVEQSRVDVDAAAADLAKAQVLTDYTRITSPYEGIVTRRSFHDGDFIRSAAEGGNTPVLSVARSDLMRVVVMVPDLDVPYVDVGDPATIAVDALAGQVFQGKVSRFAYSETELKLMRTEVDLPNPDNKLRDGMYGTATLLLEPPSQNMTVPSTCLIEQSDNGDGAVYLVRSGKVHRQRVRVGKDDGRECEIIEGLSLADHVVVRYNGSIAEGLAVETSPLKDTGTKDHAEPESP